MHELYKLKEMLCKELEEYGSKGELTGGTLEVVDKLAHAVKNLDKIIEAKEMDEYDSFEGGMGGSYARDGGMSGEGRSYARGGNRGGRGGYSRDGGSYAQGRGRNARRDSMGRYSSRGGYSRADNEEYVEQLEEMMQEVPQEAQRHIQKAIQEMQQM
ncbi:MAG: hypothetical protein IJ089_10070 [Clostridia bacterium]|nr:hypothetical protein [Clostridia bacterium]